MKHISILATPNTNLASLDNPRQGFLFVNKCFRENGKPPLFEVQIVGLTKEIPLQNGLCTLHADFELKDIKHTDLILIPAFDGGFKMEPEEIDMILPWMIKHYQKGAEIASLCVGTFLLASTGLLNGRQCSTHWRAASSFKKLFPKVHLHTEKVITDENGLYTSGGAFSASNLILYLIEKYAGRDIAIQSSKMFQIDIDRNSQSPFIIFHGQKNHKDEQVKAAQRYIEKNYHEKISVTEISDKLALSRRNLERRFKKATHNTIVEYMQRVKVEAVKKELESGTSAVNQLMYDVGYSDTKAFRNVFKRYAGLTPVAYRNKYSKKRSIVG